MPSDEQRKHSLRGFEPGLSHVTRRVLVFLVGILVLAAGLGCGRHRPNPSPTRARVPAATSAAATLFVPGDAERGKALVAKFECNRCHDETGLESVAREQHCIHCHRDIVSGTFPAPPLKLAKWSKTAVRYQDVPSLQGLTLRLRPEWIVQFVREPHQIRPQLGQSMPRLVIDAEQARDMVTYFSTVDAVRRGLVPASAAPPVEGNTAHGRELFETRGCTACHEFTGARVVSRPAAPTFATDTDRSVALAPDLRFTRERYLPGALAKWLVNPSALKPDTRMPNLGLTPVDAVDLASFVLTTRLDPPPRAVVVARRPVLDRPVSFAEVNERVLMKTCRHCHTDPDKARGDGGPGNTGGFGFVPRGLDLSSYEGVSAGFVDGEGQRRSVFERLPDGTPRLVAALLARHAEQAGSPGAVRGMPLGLPPAPPEEIQLVETWIAQGRRR